VKQSVGMELLQPLTVQYVALSARHILDMTGIHQVHIEPMALKDFKNRYPVHAGGLHGNRGNAAGNQPFSQMLKVSGEG